MASASATSRSLCYRKVNFIGSYAGALNQSVNDEERFIEANLELNYRVIYGKPRKGRVGLEIQALSVRIPLRL